MSSRASVTGSRGPGYADGTERLPGRRTTVSFLPPGSGCSGIRTVSPAAKAGAYAG